MRRLTTAVLLGLSSIFITIGMAPGAHASPGAVGVHHGQSLARVAASSNTSHETTNHLECGLVSPYLGIYYDVFTGVEKDGRSGSVLTCEVQSSERPPAPIVTTAGVNGCGLLTGPAIGTRLTEDMNGEITLECWN